MDFNFKKAPISTNDTVKEAVIPTNTCESCIHFCPNIKNGYCTSEDKQVNNSDYCLTYRDKNNLNIIDIFSKKKLYDDFYIYLAEEGQFELLQEKIEQFLAKYNNNEIEENNKFKIIEFINKINNVKTKLNELFKYKTEYENMKLHLDKNAFRVLLDQIHERTGYRTDVLEKDYYVVLMLYELY